MNSPIKEGPDPSREELEDEAARVRERLTSDIDELKRRGRAVADGARALRLKVREHPIIAAGVALGAVVALGFALRARRVRRRRAERRELLLGLSARLLGPAYVVKPPEPKPSAVKNALGQAGRELAVAAGREFGRRALLAVAGATEASGGEPGKRPA
jgi:hypothetical protein